MHTKVPIALPQSLAVVHRLCSSQVPSIKPHTVSCRQDDGCWRDGGSRVKAGGVLSARCLPQTDQVSSAQDLLAVPPGTHPSALPCGLDAAGSLQALDSDLPQPKGKPWGCRPESSLVEASAKGVISSRPLWVHGYSTLQHTHIPRATAVSESTMCPFGSFSI